MIESEKEKIERATAEAFLDLYNAQHGTDYKVEEYADAPDIRCIDSQGNKFNLEITMTEDRPGDIQARLGRSDGRSLEALIARQDAGIEDEPGDFAITHSTAVLIQRIRAKMNKRYGPHTALVVRDTSGVGWDRDLDADEVKQHLAGIENPFDMGIWVISTMKDKIFLVP